MGHPTVDCEGGGRVFFMGYLERVTVVCDNGPDLPGEELMDLCPECKEEFGGESL